MRITFDEAAGGQIMAAIKTAMLHQYIIQEIEDRLIPREAFYPWVVTSA